MSQEPAVAVAAPPQATSSLRPNAVGLMGVLFQSVTLMGPGVAIAFGVVPGITYAGGSFPLALLLALVGCLLLASNIGQLAIHLPSAGGMYTYISRGLGSNAGFLAGWLSIPAYLLFIPLSLLAFGYFFGKLSGEPGWIFALALTVVMALLTYFGVRPSLRTLVTMGAIELAVFILLSILLVLHPAEGNTLRAFTPATWAHNRGGITGVLVGTVIAFLFFAGFESSALLAEESREPRRSIPRAIYLSVIGIGVFFVFASYAGLAGFGFSHIGTTTDANSYLGAQPTPWFTLATRVWGTAGQYIIGLVILNSLAANVGAGFTALARVVFAMGRAGALPAAFGKTSRRFRTPTLAIFAAALVSLGIAGWSARVYGPPPNSFYALVDTAGYTVLLAYIGVSLAVPFYFRRERASEFNAVRHVAIPALAVALLAVVLGAQLVFAIAPDNYPGLLPQFLGAAVTAVWLVVGVVWLLVLRATRPSALEAGERVYLEAATTSR